MPATQVGRALRAPSQTVPQVPQFDVSVWESTQLPLQFAVPFGQLEPHTPIAHTRPGSHTVSQSPLWAASVRVSTHSEPHSV
jgi:hypothetical protein